MEVVGQIGVNVVLLFALVFIVTLTHSEYESKKPFYNALIGLFIGSITIIIMLNAWELQTGAIFDTRSVILSVTALFFPYITAIIATLLSIIYRAYVGGVGVYAGILSMLFASLIGMLWRYHIRQSFKLNRYVEFYIFGVLVHIFVLLSQLAFPYPLNIEVVSRVSWMMLIVFPIATMLLSVALLNQQNKNSDLKLLKDSEKKYRTLVGSAKLGIIQYNTLGVIELANQSFADLLNAPLSKIINLDMTKLPNKKFVACVHDSINGVKALYEGDYQSVLSGRTLPVRAQFSPIYEDYKVIGGIGIVEDLSEKQKHQKEIERLTKFDRLTNLYNRTSFDNDLFNNSIKFSFPVCLVIFDINTFQIINTTFGYDVGNDILRRIAYDIKKVLEDYPEVNAYRTGGDEFSLISDGLNQEKIDTLVSKIKHTVESLHNYSINLKLSHGYSIAADSSKSLIDTFNEAVQNLHENKIYEGSSISKKTVDIIMTTLFEKSPREKMHSERVSKLAETIAKLLKASPELIKRVKLAARLHDIGKINISETILDKPGQLTLEEYEVVKKHSGSGFKILSSVPEYSHIANIVYAHHERFDGKGYPRGLEKDEIPLEARIIAVADAYDAMIEQRTYRKVLTVNEALDELKTHSGTQFDPNIVAKFNDYMHKNELK